MPYNLHPSERLRALFKAKPWQGNDPLLSDFVFVGLDANYAADIETILPEVFSYHEDGVKFWRSTGVHHPCRLRHYHGKGKLYHDKFAEIGFKPEHAESVSFLELLDVPTTGSKLTVADLTEEHLSFLLDVFENGSARYIFMPSSVANILRETRSFRWLPRYSAAKGGDLTILRERLGQTIYQMYHLSCYGWQLHVLNKQLSQVRRIVESHRFNYSK